MSNGVVLRSDKVKEGLKFDTSLEELLDQLEPILPNTITQELSKRIPNTPDEFLNDFLELQDQACGPTVDELMQALHIPTYALFGLTNEDWHKGQVDQRVYDALMNRKIEITD